MTVFEKIWFVYTLVVWCWLFLGCIISYFLIHFLIDLISVEFFDVFLSLVFMPVITWLVLEVFYLGLKVILCIWGINLDLFPSIT